jgi:hypothetical protein
MAKLTTTIPVAIATSAAGAVAKRFASVEAEASRIPCRAKRRATGPRATARRHYGKSNQSGQAYH